MMERGAANAMERNRDRISEIPEFIIHQILSYLSTKEAAQKSVLSKTWLQAWSTSPNLNLNERYFSEYEETEEDRHTFFNFVNNTLLRYCTHNLRIHKFKILLYHVEDAFAYRLLDQSIGTALDHGVKELCVSVETTFKLSPYTLPQTIFSTSARALTNLKVHGCKFPQNFASNAINFPFLKKLNLRRAYMDDGTLQKLLSSCPSVEEVVLYRVLGLKKFLVSNLGELKKLLILSHAKPIEVEIEDAPSLHFLMYCESFMFNLHCYLKVAGSAQNLKRLELSTVTITDNFLNDHITKFPLLEVLKIISCNGLERINVSGRSLEQLHLMGCKDLVEANIYAPNLLKLMYNGDKVLSLTMATRNSNSKCWCRYCENIEVEAYENSQNAWQPLPWETLLVKSIFLDEAIRFSVKWNAKYALS